MTTYETLRDRIEPSSTSTGGRGVRRSAEDQESSGSHD